MNKSNKTLFLLFHTVDKEYATPYILSITLPSELYSYTIFEPIKHAWQPNGQWIAAYWNKNKSYDRTTHNTKNDAFDWCITHWIENEQE